MSFHWNMIIWQQFGAAIDMLDVAIRLCPDENWMDAVWEDTDAAEYGQFWFVAYHTLMWLDFYLSGLQRQDFVPPAPFLNRVLPDKPYSKEDVRAYLVQNRRKVQATLEAMTEDKARQPYVFPWGSEMSFAELMLYKMRHVQEHAAQLSLHLGRIGAGAELDWISYAGEQSTQ